MKKGLFSILAGALLVVGCQNYDDQFSNIESQITALASQVAGLSQVQSDLTALAGTVNSLQTSVAETVDTALADGLADIDAAVASLEAATATAASSEDVAAIAAAVTAQGTDLDELLANSSVFTGDVNVNSVATLEAFLAMGSSLNILNGNLTMNVVAGMDATKVQNLVNNVLTITKDLNYTGASTEAVPTFLNLSGVQSLTIAASGDYRFDNLVTATKIILNNNSSKTTIVAFDKLTSYTSISDDTGTSGLVHMPNATNLHLTAVAIPAGNKLDLKVKKGGTIKLDGLTGKTSAGLVAVMDIDIDGPAVFASTVIADGTINLLNVADATISGFYGAITAGTGVDKLTTTKAVTLSIAAADDLQTANLDVAIDWDPALTAAQLAVKVTAGGPAVTFVSQDLTTAKVTGVAGNITASAQNNLTSLTIVVTGGADLNATGNTDLDTLKITGSTFNDVTVDNNDNLTSLILDHTTKATATVGGKVIIQNNDDLLDVTITTDKVQQLTIKDNSDLTTIGSATSIPSIVGKATVYIGGNKFTASQAKDDYNSVSTVDSGKFTSASGLDKLSPYLTAAAANPLSVKAFYDVIESHTVQGSSATATYSDGTTTVNQAVSTDISVIVWVTANTTPAGTQSTAGKNGYTFDFKKVITDGNTIQLTVDGYAIFGGSNNLTYSAVSGRFAGVILNANSVANNISMLKDAAHLTRATQAGIKYDVKAGGQAVGTVSLIDWVNTGINDAGAVLGERANTLAKANLAHVALAEVDADDVITFTVGSNTVTTSVVSTANTGTNIGAAIIAAWLAKYDGQIGTASASANATVTNVAGVLTVTMLDLGSRGDAAISMSVAAGTGAQSNTTALALDWVIGTTRATNDNKTLGQSMVLSVESLAKGTANNAVDGTSVAVAPTNSSTALAAATYKILGADTGAGTYVGASEARNDVLLAEDGVAAAASNAIVVNKIIWLTL